MTDITQQAGPGAGAEPLLAYLESQKFHPSASHVPPDYRDGFNRALQVVIERVRDEQRMQALAVEDSRERCASSDAKDAARYRFIRDPKNDCAGWGPFYAGEGLDNEVDAAMAAASSGKEN